MLLRDTEVCCRRREALLRSVVVGEKRVSTDSVEECVQQTQDV